MSDEPKQLIIDMSRNNRHLGILLHDLIDGHKNAGLAMTREIPFHAA